MRTRLLTLLGVSVLLLAGCSAPTPPPAADCGHPVDADTSDEPADGGVFGTVSLGADTYDMTYVERCTGLQWDEAVAIELLIRDFVDINGDQGSFVLMTSDDGSANVEVFGPDRRTFFGEPLDFDAEVTVSDGRVTLEAEGHYFGGTGRHATGSP